MKSQINTDRLSQLPNELLINILSRLTLPESGRASVLSRRWKNLWLSTNHCSGSTLIFNGLHIFERCSTSFELKRLLFVGLVNKVIQFNQREHLDELVTSSHFTLIPSITIDHWIKFALTKGIQRLELALSLCDLGTPYVFPSLHSFGSFGVHRLRALCLKGVDVDQTALDSLFSTFPLLDSLSLKLWKFENLNFSSVKLKHLELSYLHSSYDIKRYEISAPNLVTFGYEGKVSGLRLTCIPCLSEFYVRDQDGRPFFTRLDMHLSYIDRLKKLKLNLGVLTCLAIRRFYPLNLPLLVNLEEFEVKFLGFDGDSFLWPTIFIKASPFLSRFSVDMDVISPSSIDFSCEEEKRRIKEVTKFRHVFLKAVEISGFSGYNCEMELAQHLIDIGAQSLEKVVISTRYDRVDGKAKMCAQSLGQGLDSSVEFVVR